MRGGAATAANKYNKLLASGKFGVKFNESLKTDILNYYIKEWFEVFVKLNKNPLARALIRLCLQ